MQRKNALPLIDGVEIRPVIKLLDEVGTTASKILIRANVPVRCADEPGTFVSARSMLRFVSLAASESGIENLGWRAATGAEITQLGRWGETISRCRTLRKAITTFCVMYSREVSFVELGLSFDSEHAWLWRRRDLASRDPSGEAPCAALLLPRSRDDGGGISGGLLSDSNPFSFSVGGIRSALHPSNVGRHG